MKKLIFFFLAFAISSTLFAQDETNASIEEGIKLHDKGEYEAAVAKYDQVLKKEPANFRALYEKSYTLYEMKKYEESEAICKQLLQEKNTPYKKNVYVQYGNLLDVTNRQKESLDIYNKGISEFPDFHLLYFNKGITLSGLDRSEEAVVSFQEGIKLKPLHASGHSAVARMIRNQNRIPAVMAFFTFLLIEPQSDRAAQNLEYLNALVTKGVQQTDSNNISITIDASTLDKKNKKRENNFSDTELIFSLSSALDNSEKFKNENEAERLERKLDMLITSLSEGRKKHKGFYWSYYVPFFTEMKSKNFLGTACYVVNAGSGDEKTSEWLKDNEGKVNEFYTWLKSYSWTK